MTLSNLPSSTFRPFTFSSSSRVCPLQFFSFQFDLKLFFSHHWPTRLDTFPLPRLQKSCPNTSFLQVLYSFNPTTLDIAATGSPLHTRPTDPLGPLKPLPRISRPRDFEFQKHHTHTKTSTARLRSPGLHEPRLCALRCRATLNPFQD